MTTSGIEKLKVEHLSSAKGAKLMLVEFPPGSSTGEEGDSFSWNACTPHRVSNISDAQEQDFL
ncbi:hypothetical protein [Cohnella yongneupensis]|uniref:Uncharacterized protein n=1 Tax=Cohnella yongneupensis TaxID=425006 RepID=A0ABW0R1B1_9BACL